MVHPRVIVPRTRTSRPFLQRPERERVWLGPVPRLSKGGAKAEQTGCIRRMATLQPNCGHSGFRFLPVARGKECYPFFPRGKKKSKASLSAGPRAPAAKLHWRAKGHHRERTTLHHHSLCLLRGGRDPFLTAWRWRQEKSQAWLTTHETGAARSERRAGDSAPCSPVRSAAPSQDEYRWERKWGFPSSLNSVMVFAPPRVEK